MGKKSRKLIETNLTSEIESLKWYNFLLGTYALYRLPPLTTNRHSFILRYTRWIWIRSCVWDECELYMPWIQDCALTTADALLAAESFFANQKPNKSVRHRLIFFSSSSLGWIILLMLVPYISMCMCSVCSAVQCSVHVSCIWLGFLVLLAKTEEQRVTNNNKRMQLHSNKTFQMVIVAKNSIRLKYAPIFISWWHCMHFLFRAGPSTHGPWKSP